MDAEVRDRTLKPRSGELRIHYLEAPQDFQRWDAFVLSAPDGTFFHRAGWKTVIETAFGHSAYFLFAESDGNIQGVLPLAQVTSLLFGNALISTPFCVYGGVLAATGEAARALEVEACRLAHDLGVHYLELRNRVPRNPDWASKDLYVTFRKHIHADDHENMNAIPRKQRAMVRKGIQAGLIAEIDEDVDRVYRVYAESVRNLGTPVFSKRYFRTLKQVFGESCELLAVRHGDDIVAGVMNFYFRDEVLPYYGGGTATARDLKANDFMYWEVMRHAVRRGVRIFDYGRSKRDTGSFRFKTHWGFEPEPLHYEYHLVRAKEMPNLSPTNPRYARFIRVWQRLPLPVTCMIGPLLARNLG